jgi:hypothetical protein
MPARPTADGLGAVRQYLLAREIGEGGKCLRRWGIFEGGGVRRFPDLHIRSRVDHTFFVGAPVVVAIVWNECHLPSANCVLISLPSRREAGLFLAVDMGAPKVEIDVADGVGSVQTRPSTFHPGSSNDAGRPVCRLSSQSLICGS